MFDFFDFVTELANTIIQFFLNFFDMLKYLLTFITQGFAYTVRIIAYLPGWVMPFVLAVISFSVIMFILNR